MKSVLALVDYAWADNYNEQLKINKPKKSKKEEIKEEKIKKEIAKLNVNVVMIQFNKQLDSEYLEYLQSKDTDLADFILHKYFNKIDLDLKIPLKKIIQEYLLKYKINQLKCLAFIFMLVVNSSITEILPLVTDWKKDSRVKELYLHSWTGFPDEQKEDARPIFEYLGNNIEVSNRILSKVNLTVDAILAHNFFSNVSWSELVTDMYDKYRDQQLERIIRQYLLEQNNFYKEEYSKKLSDNGDKADDQEYLHFNPRYDLYRSNPIIILRVYNNEDYNKFKRKLITKKQIRYVDKVIKGELGSSHINTLQSNPQYEEAWKINKEINGSETNVIWTCAYQLGDIGFLPNVGDDVNNYVAKKICSLKYLARMIQAQLHIDKVYLIPQSDVKVKPGQVKPVAKESYIIRLARLKGDGINGIILG